MGIVRRKKLRAGGGTDNGYIGTVDVKRYNFYSFFFSLVRDGLFFLLLLLLLLPLLFCRGGCAGGNLRFRKNSLSPYCTPLPVASTRPCTPPKCTGLPVTQPWALISDGCNLWYSSAIHDIVLCPVPISGAGTFNPGPRNPLLSNS